MPDAPTNRDACMPRDGVTVTRRHALQRLAVGMLAAPAILRGRYRIDASGTTEYSARAIRLVQETVVVDLLNQFRFADFADTPPKSTLWLTKPHSMSRADFDTYRTSGYNVLAIGQGPTDFESGVRFFADWNGFIAEYPDWLMRIDDAEDFDAVKKSGKLGIMITFQNSDHFRTI